jgi:hypothetical protein
VSYNKSGCGDTQPSRIAIRSSGLSRPLDRGRVRGRQLELRFETDPNMSVVRLAKSELLDLKPALLEPACHCPAVQLSKWLVRVSLIANTGRTTSYKALQNSKIMIK